MLTKKPNNICYIMLYHLLDFLFENLPVILIIKETYA